MNKVIPFLIFLFFPVCTFSQPGTEIYLFDLKFRSDKIILKKPRNITQRKGYDNQPFFHPDEPVLYFVSANSDGRTDIMTYNYKSKETKKVTETSEREYSPTVTPDKKFISCIIQRDDGRQDLGKYPINGGEAELIIDNLTVGYHAWADENKVVVFTLPRPFKLHIRDLKSGADSVVAKEIGRSLHRIPGTNAISFVQKVNDEVWDINRLDATTLKISTIEKSPPSLEHDMAWTPAGTIIMSVGKELFFFTPGRSLSWREIEIKGDLKNTISRIAVDSAGKYLAMVVSEE